MADNVAVTAKVLAALQLTETTVAADEIGGVVYQRVKATFGVDGVATDVSASDPLPVTANLRASSASNQGSQVSVTASPAVTVLASNADRKGFRIYYPSAVWVSYGGTASSSTFLLPAGSVDEMTDGLIYTGAISAISVSGTITAYVVEW